jgi:hypothetical protein
MGLPGWVFWPCRGRRGTRMLDPAFEKGRKAVNVEAFLDYLFSYSTSRDLAVEVAWVDQRRTAPVARRAS